MNINVLASILSEDVDKVYIFEERPDAFAGDPGATTWYYATLGLVTASGSTDHSVMIINWMSKLTKEEQDIVGRAMAADNHASGRVSADRTICATYAGTTYELQRGIYQEALASLLEKGIINQQTRIDALDGTSINIGAENEITTAQQSAAN